MTPPAANPRQNRPGGQAAGPVQPENVGPSAAGTRRRLRALAARSWSPEAIEKETGIPAQLIRRDLDGYDDLAPNLAGAVAAAYDRLWDRDPPAATRADREAAAAIADRAGRGGWAPPMAWDDDLIDLPGARPEQGWRPGRRVSTVLLYQGSRGRPRAHRMLTETSPIQDKLAATFGLAHFAPRR